LQTFIALFYYNKFYCHRQGSAEGLKIHANKKLLEA